MLLLVFSALFSLALATITTEVLPIDDSSLVLDVKSPIGLDFVDVHYVINDLGELDMRNLRMIQVTADAKHWKLPLAVLPGEQLFYKLTYQPTDGTGAKTTELQSFGEKKYDLVINSLGNSMWKATFIPLTPDFLVEMVDLHYSVDGGATLENIALRKLGDVWESPELPIDPNAEKVTLFATYIVNGKGVETGLKEIPLRTRGVDMLPTRTTALGSLFSNLQTRRDGYLRQSDFEILPPLMNQDMTALSPQVIEKGDHLWAIEVRPQGQPQFIDVNAEVSFQGQVYQVNQKLEDIGGGVYSHPPIPLGASDAIVYRLTYWLDGMQAAVESPEFTFSPGS